MLALSQHDSIDRTCLKIVKDYAKIQNLMSFSTETMANSDIDKFLLDLTERDDLLMSYYKIDVQLVNNCVKSSFCWKFPTL